MTKKWIAGFRSLWAEDRAVVWGGGIRVNSPPSTEKIFFECAYSSLWIVQKKILKKSPCTPPFGFFKNFFSKNRPVLPPLVFPSLKKPQTTALHRIIIWFFFHITSLKPLNPNNQPDDKERAALTAFENGVPEFAWEQDIGGLAHYRYMASLKVEESCLNCHAKQGYREGDIRGGISISFQMSEVQKRLQHNSLVILGLATLTICVVMLFIGLFFRGLIRKLAEARATLNQMAMTDQLTGLANRHALFERLDEEYERQKRSGQPLSVAMIDVDNFKSVNDTYGHATGDTVLQKIALHIRSGVRKYDVAARFGGEEFLVLLPNCDLINTQQTAERIRKAIEEQVYAGSGDGQRGITVSMGVASLRPGEDKEALIHRADTALYRAKADGRNRVVSEPM